MLLLYRMERVGDSNDNMENFYSSTLIPVLTPECEMWTAIERDLPRIRAAEMTFPRSCVGVRRLEGYRTSDVCMAWWGMKDTLGVKCEVIECVEKNTFRWYGHALGMNENR